MSKLKVVLSILLLSLLVACNKEPNKAENELINNIMGKWISSEDNSIFLELKENIETIGIEDSEKISQADFTIQEVNVQKQYIVIHGFIEELSEENENHTKEEFINKLELQQSGNKLNYLLNYQTENIQSEWTRP
ncbi:hypothetical protein D7Z26_00225 [Cohnella endophytica]|uniref:Lipoprotein n=1 Tax=Cohnella endophytica TaxID=2419778 RepID=A0A494Y8Q8_9BACL|nr:hypothetical protein [Cohnella endophytica]RKP57978.1 hypothetical protein D7Z26_00225 [Cohnella endophytica]